MSEPPAPEVPEGAQNPSTPGPIEAVEASPTHAAAGPMHAPAFRIAAAIVIVLALGLIVWLVARDNGGSNNGGAPPAASNAAAVSVAQLQGLAKSVGHPVFWVGPKQGTIYELSRATNGSIYVRYLPEGTEVGTKDLYLTVATYPYPGAYAAIQAVTKEPNTTAIPLADGGLAESSTSSPTNVHAAFPEVDFQAEVFDPAPGAAEALVADGKLTAIGSLDGPSATAAGPKATTPAALTKLATTLGHSIYWAGTKPGYTYELVQTTDGQVLIRYLPKGVKVGSSGQYLTIGTYPYPGALARITDLSAGSDVDTIELAGGGLAVVDKKGKNVHLAFPGSDFQVEVFAPSAATARRVVASGQVESIG